MWLKDLMTTVRSQYAAGQWSTSCDVVRTLSGMALKRWMDAMCVSIGATARPSPRPRPCLHRAIIGPLFRCIGQYLIRVRYNVFNIYRREVWPPNSNRLISANNACLTSRLNALIFSGDRTAFIHINGPIVLRHRSIGCVLSNTIQPAYSVRIVSQTDRSRVWWRRVILYRVSL